MQMDNSTTIIRFLPWALIAAAAGPLGTAYIAEFAFGYEPCVLCLYQRIPYGIIAVLGIAVLFITRADLKRHLVLFAGVVFLSGSAVALYHVGVEQHWWTSAAPCGASGAALTTTEDLFAALQKKAEKSCGDIDWTLFGVSMATYNVAVSFLCALASFWAWRRLQEPTSS